MISLFAKKDPICGMKMEKDKGITKHGQWFCSKNCLQQYEKPNKKMNRSGCCH